MMKWIILLITLPLTEIVVLFRVNDIIGVFYTLITIIITALIGTILVQKQGAKILFRIKTKSENPIQLISNGLFIAVAGILLLTPGFITDSLGFLTLIPNIRQKTINYLIKNITK